MRELEVDYVNENLQPLSALRRLRYEERPTLQDSYHKAHNFDLSLLFSIQSYQHFPVNANLLIFCSKNDGKAKLTKPIRRNSAIGS